MSKGLHERGLDDDFRKKMERENATLRTRVSELDEELCRVLADWNALVEAVGARTNGTAIGEATQLRARVTALEGTVATLREALADALVPIGVLVMETETHKYLAPELNASLRSNLINIFAVLGQPLPKDFKETP